tara:strand:+ start:964 stop:1224 length:261 start_codon:yes stop_codon:yes gene_type:complete
VITSQIKGEIGHTRLSLDVNGDKATVVFSLQQCGDDGVAMMTLTDNFKVEDFINLGKSLTLNELADQIKSDAITNAKLLRGDFNSL